MAGSQQVPSPVAVVFDLEFTAWEGSMAACWLRPGEFQEIVQIGAVKVDEDFNAGETFALLVRPRFNPVLSPYLEGLTGITNEAMRAGSVDFAEHFEDGLVGAAVERPPQGAHPRRRARKQVRPARPHDAHGRSAAVLFVVGMKDENQVQGVLDLRPQGAGAKEINPERIPILNSLRQSCKNGPRITG